MEKCLAWHQVGAVVVQHNLDKHPVVVDSKEPAKCFAVVVVDFVHCIPGSASPNPSNPYARGSGSGYGGGYPKPSQGYPTTPQGYK